MMLHHVMFNAAHCKCSRLIGPPLPTFLTKDVIPRIINCKAIKAIHTWSLRALIQVLVKERVPKQLHQLLIAMAFAWCVHSDTP